MSDLTKAIREKGYWYIDVRPAEYVGDRVPYTSLGPILDRTVVRLRGWDFPHIDRQRDLQRGNTWIGGETDWSWFKEAWRFYRSGQYVDDINRMPMDRTRPFSEPIVYSAVTLSRDDLAGRSRSLAIDAAAELFERFGFHPTRALLEGQQSELRWPK